MPKLTGVASSLRRLLTARSVTPAALERANAAIVRRIRVPPDTAHVVAKQVYTNGGHIRGSLYPVDIVFRRQQHIEIARTQMLPDRERQIGTIGGVFVC